MAVTYTAAVKTARMDAVRAQIDAGGGAGKLEIGTAGMATVLFTVTLNATSGVAAAGVLTLSGFPKTQAATAAGTAAAARVRNFANTDIITGLTVGTSGADVVLDNLVIANGQSTTINSATITHAA